MPLQEYEKQIVLYMLQDGYQPPLLSDAKWQYMPKIAQYISDLRNQLGRQEPEEKFQLFIEENYARRPAEIASPKFSILRALRLRT